MGRRSTFPQSTSQPVGLWLSGFRLLLITCMPRAGVSQKQLSFKARHNTKIVQQQEAHLNSQCEELQKSFPYFSRAARTFSKTISSFFLVNLVFFSHVSVCIMNMSLGLRLISNVCKSYFHISCRQLFCLKKIFSACQCRKQLIVWQSE